MKFRIRQLGFDSLYISRFTRPVVPQSRKYYFLSEETDDRDWRELQQQVTLKPSDEDSGKDGLGNK